MEKEIIQLQQTNQLLRETAAKELLLKELISSSLQTSFQCYIEHCSTIPYLVVIDFLFNQFKVYLIIFLNDRMK